MTKLLMRCNMQFFFHIRIVNYIFFILGNEEIFFKYRENIELAKPNYALKKNFFFKDIKLLCFFSEILFYLKKKLWQLSLYEQ